ncbi:helix-turn-helix transcriptional regulator, partial [Weissella confusa]
MKTEVDTTISSAVRGLIDMKHIPVCDILKHAGISSSRYYTFVNGQGDITVHKLHAMLRTLNVGLDELCLFIEPKSTEDATASPVINAIAEYQRTRDVSGLINLQDKNDFRPVLLSSEEAKRIKPVLNDVLRRSEYYTMAELKAFLLYLNYFTYDEILAYYPKAMTSIHFLTQKLKKRHDAARHDVLHVISFLVYQLLLISIQRGQSQEVHDLLHSFFSLPFEADDWMTLFLRGSDVNTTDLFFDPVRDRTSKIFHNGLISYRFRVIFN